MTPEELYQLSIGALDHEHVPRERYIRAPFGWPGGKDLSKKHILPRLPIRDSYIETCGGSGIIMLNRDRSNLEVFNDRDAGVVAFYRCIRDRDKLDLLKQRLDLTVHSREEFIWSKATWRNCEDDVERAARWFYMIRLSFSQLGRNFARATSGQSPNTLSTYVTSVLPEFDTIHRRLRGVQIENQDIRQIIEDFDQDDAVFYMDPNYVESSKGIYEHELTQEDHYSLCRRVMKGKGFFALSGYDNEIYSQFPWDEVIRWSVPVSSKAQAYTASNYKLELKGQDTRNTAIECLFIRDNTKG